MSYGIAVRQLDRAGGVQLAGEQSFFRIDAQAVALQGDPVTPHGQNKHARPFMAQGSSWMRLNGIPVCRAGHQANCGHPSSGRPWFVIPD